MRKLIRWGTALTRNSFLAIALASVLTGCNDGNRPLGPVSLNSRYTDEQAALSGDGHFLAFISNRNGANQILVYDLRQEQFVNLPGLNPRNAIAQTPSLSYTGRYLVYIANIEGRPEIALYDRAIKRSELLSRRYRSWIRNPRISPDGRYIVFESARRGQWDVEVLDRGPKIELDLPDGIPLE